MRPMCKCQGCDREARYVASGMCQRHHRNMRLYGTQEAPARKRTPLLEQIKAAVVRGMAAATALSGRAVSPAAARPLQCARIG